MNTAGSSASSHHSQLLYDKWVLDVPKLLDMAAIYGPDNAPLVQQLMQQVIKPLPFAAALKSLHLILITRMWHCNHCETEMMGI